MRKSFYQYVMTLRSPKKDALSEFAEAIFSDVAFPKQAHDFETISHYLEFNNDYYFNLDLFDEIYQDYLENNG